MPAEALDDLSKLFALALDLHGRGQRAACCSVLQRLGERLQPARPVSRRDLAAIAAMAGIVSCAQPATRAAILEAAADAVEMADCLLAQLDEK